LKIEIEDRSDGWFVACDDKWESGLTWDEALGTVASLIITKKAHYLKDAIGHALWEARYGYYRPRIANKSSVTTDNE